jgi:hypothetical protein
MKREIKNGNQRATTFFLTCLGDVVLKKNLLSPNPVQRKCTTIHLMKIERTLKSHKKIILKRKHPNLGSDYSYANRNLGKIQVLLFNIFSNNKLVISVFLALNFRKSKLNNH